MSELALRSYIQAQLTANEVLPSGTGRFKSFTAHRHMAKREVLGSHVVLQVGRMRSKETRLAGARGIGTKVIEWTADLLVVANGTSEEPVPPTSATASDADDFSTLVEATKEVFRNSSMTPLPATLTDPETSRTSTLTHIGETIDHETLDPDMEAIQGRVLFRAVITVTAKETITGY